MEKTLLKIALLNDLLHSALVDVNPDKIDCKNTREKIMQLRLRNSIKSAKLLSKTFDDFFEKENLTTMFGDLADEMDKKFTSDYNYFLANNKTRETE